jgi:hypothetical protein
MEPEDPQIYLGIAQNIELTLPPTFRTNAKVTAEGRPIA